MPSSMISNNKQSREMTNHVVISNATMISSFKMRDVNEIDTMCRNSLSKRMRDMIIMAAPSKHRIMRGYFDKVTITYLDID